MLRRNQFWEIERLLWAGAAALLIALPGHAQTNYLLQTGAPTFTTAEPVELGFLNVSNGNLHLEIPITSSAQRGKLSYSARLVYDSRIWAVVNTGSSVWEPTNAGGPGGWRLLQDGAGTAGYAHGVYSCSYTCGPGGKQCNASYHIDTNFTYTDTAGTVRHFPIYIETGNICHNPAHPSTTTGSALDASGYSMSAYDGGINYVKAPDGTQVYPVSEDTNGNCFSTSSLSPGTCPTTNPPGNVFDTLNRTPLTSSGNGNTTTYTVLTAQGPENVIVTTSTVYVHTAFGQAGVTEYQGHFTAPTQIQLPDGTTYLLSYDTGTSDTDPNIHYGLLTSITLPTAGMVTYGYTNFSDADGAINRWVNSRTARGGQWTYAPTTGCGTSCQTVTVTRPSNDQTVYTFNLSNGAWKTTAKYYSGSSTLLMTVQNAYDYSLPDPVDGGSGFVRLTNTTVTLPLAEET